MRGHRRQSWIVGDGLGPGLARGVSVAKAAVPLANHRAQQARSPTRDLGAPSFERDDDRSRATTRLELRCCRMDLDPKRAVVEHVVEVFNVPRSRGACFGQRLVDLHRTGAQVAAGLEGQRRHGQCSQLQRQAEPS